MKLKAKQYAQALYELSVECPENQKNDNVVKFANFLIKNQQVNLLDKIIIEFVKYFKVKQNIIDVIITVPNAIDEQALATEISKKINKKIDFKVKQDPKIIAGMILQIGDLIYDNSVNNKLNLLHNQLINN